MSVDQGLHAPARRPCSLLRTTFETDRKQSYVSIAKLLLGLGVMLFSIALKRSPPGFGPSFLETPLARGIMRQLAETVAVAHSGTYNQLDCIQNAIDLAEK